MPRVEFEPTIPAFERAKTVHALDRTASVIGYAGTVYVNYLLHISAFRPSSNMHTYCWLHCSTLKLASVYSGYLLCYLFHILGCNSIVYVLVEMLNLKILKLYRFVKF
jgi:hypothetical protein